jgi:hypothetical protein
MLNLAAKTAASNILVLGCADGSGVHYAGAVNFHQAEWTAYSLVG